MSYKMIALTPRVFYCQLLRYPTSQESYAVYYDMKKALDAASEKIYFIMDFRKGMFTDVGMLRQAGKLTQHRHFGASIGFGGDVIKEVFGDVFADTAQQPDDLPREMQPNATAAVAMLEKLCPGILEGVDWQSVIPK